MNKLIKKLFLFGLMCLCLSCTSGFRTFKQTTYAMSPSIKKGDWFIAIPSNEIQRGDIIVFKYPNDTAFSDVFRVVGLPNETVQLKDNRVFIDGNLLDEPHLAQENNVKKLKDGIYSVPNENFFVLGDNRDNSIDSRFWGTVPRNLIYGKFYTKYFHKDE